MANALPNNIGDLRKERGLSQEALAAKIGEDVTGATISRIESGRMQLTLDWMVRISDALGVLVHELLPTGSSPVRWLPKIGQISAGTWQDAVTETTKFVPVPFDKAGPNSFVLEPIGDSMNLVVTPGSDIVIDPDQRELIAGKIYAFRNEHHETTFKRYLEGPPRLEPCSDNPEHKMILLGAELTIVIGRVVLAVQTFD